MKGGDGRRGREGRVVEGRGGVRCGARRPAGARGPALAKDGPGYKNKRRHNSRKNLR